MLNLPVLPNQGSQPFSWDDNCMEALESDIIFTIRDIEWQSDSKSQANRGIGVESRSTTASRPLTVQKHTIRVAGSTIQVQSEAPSP